jgi:hypothetical protein
MNAIEASRILLVFQKFLLYASAKSNSSAIPDGD